MPKTGRELGREISEAMSPTSEARRHAQTIQGRERFPEILSHHGGLRSVKSASRSRVTPSQASRIVTRYLEFAESR